MFLMRREFKYFRKRILLISFVVGMLTVLTSFLSGLTGGLADQNISSVLKLKGDHIIVQDGVKTLTDSTISESFFKSAQYDKSSYHPLGISQFNINSGESKSGVTIFGKDTIKGGSISLSKRVAEELNVKVGDEVNVGGMSLNISKINSNDWYGHAPVVNINIDDWRKFQKNMTGVDTFATLLETDEDVKDIFGYKVYNKYSLLPLVGSFRSEVGSLALIIGMLVVISSFMSGAFLYIWNSQRRRDFAVIKALGGSGRLIVKTVISQSLIILSIGILAGGVITGIFGYLLSKTTIPYMLNIFTLFLPPLILLACGVLGSLFTIKTVLKSDALEALEA